MKYIQYGGAIFECKCKCGRSVKPAAILSVNRFMSDFLKKIKNTASAVCKRCGSVRIPFVGFEK